MKVFIVILAVAVIAAGEPRRQYYQRQQSSGGNPIGAILGAKALALKAGLGLAALGTAASVGAGIGSVLLTGGTIASITCK